MSHVGSWIPKNLPKQPTFDDGLNGNLFVVMTKILPPAAIVAIAPVGKAL